MKSLSSYDKVDTDNNIQTAAFRYMYGDEKPHQSLSEYLDSIFGKNASKRYFDRNGKLITKSRKLSTVWNKEDHKWFDLPTKENNPNSSAIPDTATTPIINTNPTI